MIAFRRQTRHKRYIAEIIDAANQRDINIFDCPLQPSSYDPGSGNILGAMDALKRNRQGFAIDFLIQHHESETMPEDSTNYYLIGKVLNPRYASEKTELKEIFAKIQKEVGLELEPQWEQTYRKELARWKKAVEDWRNIDWRREDHVCSSCSGTGEDARGKSGAGSARCSTCFGKGSFTTEELQAQRKPVRPTRQQYFPKKMPRGFKSVEERIKQHGLDERVHELRRSRKTLNVFAKLVTK